MQFNTNNMCHLTKLGEWQSFMNLQFPQITSCCQDSPTSSRPNQHGGHHLTYPLSAQPAPGQTLVENAKSCNAPGGQHAKNIWLRSTKHSTMSFDPALPAFLGGCGSKDALTQPRGIKPNHCYQIFGLQFS